MDKVLSDKILLRDDSWNAITMAARSGQDRSAGTVTNGPLASYLLLA